MNIVCFGDSITHAAGHAEHPDDNLHLSARGNHSYADMVFEALKTILK